MTRPLRPPRAFALAALAAPFAMALGVVVLAVADAALYQGAPPLRRHRPRVAASAAAAAASGRGLAFATASGGAATAAATASASAAAAFMQDAPYTKRRPGRHVCSKEQAVPERQQTIETYSKPSYITYQTACHDRLGMCNTVRTVYREAYRTVVKTHFKNRTSFACCPGWMQAHAHQHGCRKAICSKPCFNNGSCTQPDVCSCTRGFTGSQCDVDIDECEEKPCDHNCVNTNGSFECYCHDGFDLQDDGRTCRSKDNVTASEAKDLLDYELISQRLLRLEEEMGVKETKSSFREDGTSTELSNKLEVMMKLILNLQNQLDNIKRKQDNVHHILALVQTYQPQFERINPLCKQVNMMEQEIQSCVCRNGRKFNFKPYNLS